MNHSLKVCWEQFFPDCFTPLRRCRVSSSMLRQAIPARHLLLQMPRATCSVTTLASLKPPASFCSTCKVSSLTLNLAPLLREQQFAEPFGEVALGSIREANAFSWAAGTGTSEGRCHVLCRVVLFHTSCVPAGPWLCS